MGVQLSVSFPWDINYGKEGGWKFPGEFCSDRQQQEWRAAAPLLPDLSVLLKNEPASLWGFPCPQSDPLHLQGSEEG